jgi:hypothetical protein
MSGAHHLTAGVADAGEADRLPGPPGDVEPLQDFAQPGAIQASAGAEIREKAFEVAGRAGHFRQVTPLRASSRAATDGDDQPIMIALEVEG